MKAVLISAVKRKKEHLVLRRLEFAFDSVTWGKCLGFWSLFFSLWGCQGEARWDG